MGAYKTGYLAKLRAVRDLTEPATATNVARYLNIVYESARTGLRRLENADMVESSRIGEDRFRVVVVYKLTQRGADTIASGVEPLGLCSRSKSVRASVPRAPHSVGSGVQWRDLHAALGMGALLNVRKGRTVRFHIDREPLAWRYEA